MPHYFGGIPLSRFLANCNGDFRRLNPTDRMAYGLCLRALRRDPGYTIDQYDDVRVICQSVQKMVSTCQYGFSPYHRFLQADANKRPFEATPSDFCASNPRIAGNPGPRIQEVEMCDVFNRFNKRLYGIRESNPRPSNPTQNSEAHADGWHERNMARIEANKRMIAQMQASSGASHQNRRRPIENTTSSSSSSSASSSAASSPSMDVDAAINEDRLEEHYRQNTERNREESERQRQIRMEADAERARKEDKQKQELVAREAAITSLADSKKSARRRGGKRHRKTSVTGGGPDSAAREETRKYESMNAVELHEEELTRLENLRISQMQVRKEALRKAREIGGS